MSSSIKFRVLIFALAIVASVLIIGAAAYTTHTEAQRLHERFANAQLSTFEIADHLQDSILRLNNNLIHYGLDRNPADLAAFQRDSLALSDWMRLQEAALVSPRERDLLTKIKSAYADYLNQASGAVGAIDLHMGPEAVLQKIQVAVNGSISIFELGHDLADSHRAVLEQFLVASRTSINRIQQVIFGCILLLLIFGAGLAIIVYRELITPMRLQLVKTQAILERQEKLAALGVLAAGVAHEIRNPLTAIKARLFIQQRGLAKNSSEHEDAVIIGTEINRLDAIVKDFLEFARPAEPRFQRLTPGPLLNGVGSLLGPQLARASIELTIEPNGEARMEADPDQIKQVLINLVQNAAESIGTGGRITLRHRVDHSRSPTNGAGPGHVVLEVEDTGKGIPPEVQRRLFDPFFSTKDTGTGLGLAIAARIVEKHGGTLEFQTQLNRGTTFGIVLPGVHET